MGMIGMAPIDYQAAKDLLFSLYQRVSDNIDINVQKDLTDNASDLDTIFNSKTQSYREVLLGCALIHLIDSTVNVRLPYINHGDGSFNGRSLDEYSVNPFLQEQLFPCSKGPYLAAFRRSVKLVPETAEGLRDKAGYSAMMNLLSVVEQCDTTQKTESFLMCLLHRFIILRNDSIIPLARISRFSIEQYRQLFTELVHYKSGGLLPVLITVAFFQTMAERYSLAWDISWQGINVADSATGAEGDVTIREDGITLLAIEITERPLDHRRIESTFNTKIILNDVKEYLFIYTNTEPDESARRAAKTLFSRGYEINFASIVELIVNNFLVLPSNARETFTNKMLSLLDSRDVSAAIKVKWNESVKSVLQI
ncbi:MAG: restriction endonuclease, SacI family [Bacteroidales bacterium]|jgi:hypothetical protein|nr:restriction endonuclease, SacI family [Bacteroidales bacterium]